MEPLPEILVWEEIVLPQAPAMDNGVNWLLWFGVLIVVLVVLGWVHYRRRPQHRAIRTIHRLQRRLSQDPNTSRNSLFELRACLREGLQSTRIEFRGADEAQQRAWEQYVHELTLATFAPQTPSAQTALALAKQGEHWLREART